MVQNRRKELEGLAAGLGREVMEGVLSTLSMDTMSSHFRKDNLNSEIVLTRLTCEQACGTFSLLRIDVGKHGTMWVVPPLGELSWVV